MYSAGPARLRQLARQHLDEVFLHQDDRRELVVRIQLELLDVIAPRVTVVAAMGAAAYGFSVQSNGMPFTRFSAERQVTS